MAKKASYFGKTLYYTVSAGPMGHTARVKSGHKTVATFVKPDLKEISRALSDFQQRHYCHLKEAK